MRAVEPAAFPATMRWVQRGQGRVPDAIRFAIIREAEASQAELNVTFYAVFAPKLATFAESFSAHPDTGRLFFPLRKLMAYAAYRDPPGALPTCRATVFQVLDVVVMSVESCRLRRALATIEGVGVLRCEPLFRASAACESAAPRVRLLVRLPMSRYADVLHRVLQCVPEGEIGQLTSWRSHLQSRGITYGGYTLGPFCALPTLSCRSQWPGSSPL